MGPVDCAFFLNSAAKVNQENMQENEPQLEEPSTLVLPQISTPGSVHSGLRVSVTSPQRVVSPRKLRQLEGSLSPTRSLPKFRQSWTTIQVKERRSGAARSLPANLATTHAFGVYTTDQSQASISLPAISMPSRFDKGKHCTRLDTYAHLKTHPDWQPPARRSPKKGRFTTFASNAPLVLSLPKQHCAIKSIGRGHFMGATRVHQPLVLDASEEGNAVM
ncbi:hypothetical protein CYMTET_11413 [Cymbomonas tetramitiformis]|uniref:Uncharacterized protein n=1 Tax=Cymbomonas tetramitiformis TaxID=36881 RepID=A0AAE0GMD3_9CHLO|nr:hypothetical protein CYMTET_11413 [Cymbomonas tetramitiformis]